MTQKAKWKEYNHVELYEYEEMTKKFNIKSVPLKTSAAVGFEVNNVKWKCINIHSEKGTHAQ